MITHNKQELVHHFAMLALMVAADSSTTFRQSCCQVAASLHLHFSIKLTKNRLLIQGILQHCIFGGEAHHLKPILSIQAMNEKFAEDLRKVFGRNNQAAEDAAFISIDRMGTDVRVRHGNEYSVQRLGFDFVSASAQMPFSFILLLTS